MTKLFSRLSPRIALLLGTSAMLAALPVSARLNMATGAIELQAAVAFARGGHDDNGHDDHGRGRSSDDGAGHDRNDDHGGGNHSDDGDDDHNDDHDLNDDNGSDMSDADDDRTVTTTRPGQKPAMATTAQKRVTKAEKVGRTIEITYRDGSKEEISGGIYERKNRLGDTVEQRRSTAADFARLRDLYQAAR